MERNFFFGGEILDAGYWMLNTGYWMLVTHFIFCFYDFFRLPG
jgi:hypothetical protein